MPKIVVTLLAVLAPFAATLADQAYGVQSLMLRGVIVSYRPEASLMFYRDILGQEVVEEHVLDTERSKTYLDVSSDAKIVHLIFRGSAEYPGGPITGGRMSLITIEDPARPYTPAKNRRGQHGDVIFPHRVANLDEIYRRIQAAELEVLYSPRVSSTGRSRTMMVYDPNGKIIELFELFSVK